MTAVQGSGTMSGGEVRSATGVDPTSVGDAHDSAAEMPGGRSHGRSDAGHCRSDAGRDHGVFPRTGSCDHDLFAQAGSGRLTGSGGMAWRILQRMSATTRPAQLAASGQHGVRD